MSLIEEYNNQYQWRSWETVYDLLPNLTGHRVLDLGCGVGEQAADFISRGATAIGVDLNEDLLREARAKCPEHARFIHADFRNLPDLGHQVDGLWSSFSAAYVHDFGALLTNWKKHLTTGGWIALTEIDDLFGHEPLSPEVKSILDDYCREAYEKERYDFYMGRKLEEFLLESEFNISKTLTLDDREFSFSGSAKKRVLKAWQKRFDRMTGLHEFCGSEYEDVKKEFLSCLTDKSHQSACKVYCSIATR